MSLKSKVRFVITHGVPKPLHHLFDDVVDSISSSYFTRENGKGIEDIRLFIKKNSFVEIMRLTLLEELKPFRNDISTNISTRVFTEEEYDLFVNNDPNQPLDDAETNKVISDFFLKSTSEKLFTKEFDFLPNKSEILRVIRNGNNGDENGNTDIDARRLDLLSRYARLLQGVDYVKSPDNIEDFLKLYKDFPNFTEVIDYIVGALSISMLGEDKRFLMKPILLAGDPGVGKTAFANRVAEITQAPFKKLTFTTITAPWVLTGLDLSWNGGKPGKLFHLINDSGVANPIVLLDELDKAKTSDNGGNPLDVLHDLLEKETSVSVHDEALDLSMNLSNIIWIGTANHLDRIPESILSRFQIFTIGDITDKEEKAHVLGNLFKNVLKSTPNGDSFDDNLDQDVIHGLMSFNIRNCAVILSGALGQAAIRHLKEKSQLPIKLTAHDLPKNIRFDDSGGIIRGE